MFNQVSADPSPLWYTIGGRAALQLLKSDQQTGLMPEQVATRQAEYGLNELQETGRRSSWAILLDQFKNIMLIMLIAVAVVSGLLDLADFHQKLASGDIPFKDTAAILAIVILNGILGYVQESRAEKALAALKNMASPRVRVLRAGRISEISAKELVPGDVMLLEAGVQIAADGRLLEAINLQVREAALTGEAHAVTKQADLQLPADTPIGDRLNLVFQGTEVVQGRGIVLVTNTGMQTELGKIAAMLQAVETEPTPLQQRMDHLSQVLVTGSLVLVAIVVGTGLLLAGWQSFREMLEVSLSMAVAVVPEGLPAVITVTLALGTQRMVRRHALIRKLPAVETLGSVTHICSDKTGTLTQNKMVVQSLHSIATSFRVTGDGYVPEGEFYAVDLETSTQWLTGETPPILPHNHPELRLLLLAGLLCNDATLQKEQGDWGILGDPTEGALLVVAGKAGLQRDHYAYHFPRLVEFPFSSERKRMSVIVEKIEPSSEVCQHFPALFASHPYVLFCKGSPELILDRCHQGHWGDRLVPLASEQRMEIIQQNNYLASRGLRVLGIAYKSLPAIPQGDSQGNPQGNRERKKKKRKK